MPSKTLNKRKKSRGPKNTTKKHKRKYLGGGKYTDNDNFHRAYREIYNVSVPDAAVYWLGEVQKTNPEDTNISKIKQKLEESGRLLNDALKDIEEINDLEVLN
jgi:hypothetical protein